MGVAVTLEIDGHAIAVVDPSGGSCDAAGDFDRLLDLDGPMSVFDFPILSRIDPYGEVVFRQAEMQAVVDEARALKPYALQGPERRGIDRLRALAERGSREPNAVLRALGD